MAQPPTCILADLYQGGLDVLDSAEWFEEHRITHVVSLGEDVPCEKVLAELHGHLQYDVGGTLYRGHQFTYCTRVLI